MGMRVSCESERPNARSEPRRSSLFCFCCSSHSSETQLPAHGNSGIARLTPILLIAQKQIFSSAFGSCMQGDTASIA